MASVPGALVLSDVILRPAYLTRPDSLSLLLILHLSYFVFQSFLLDLFCQRSIIRLPPYFASVVLILEQRMSESWVIPTGIFHN